jgi:Tfp pilus assembly protein PilF
MRKINRLVCLGLLCALAGCGGQSPPDFARDPHLAAQQARELNEKATQAISLKDWIGAEKDLHAALRLDRDLGQAHNNLGVVFLNQHRLYEAASEFQLAAGLLPMQAQPYNNLGLVMESANKLETAAEFYEKALARQSECVPAMANLARVLIRLDRRDEKTRKLLEQLVLRDSRPEWNSWAREKLAMWPKSAATNSASEPPTTYPATSSQ